MGRLLNVGIIQMPVSKDTAVNLNYIEKKVNDLMGSYHRPELIVGVEGGIGYFTPQEIPGPITKYLAAIAKKHQIYFIPGTMYEKKEEGFYNSAPIFNPKGELLAVYRKMAPWRPAEDGALPGREYVVFDIPEKQTKVGVQICYDLNFPEISRNETLMGAEVLVKLTMDPEELYHLNKPVHYTRALENQAFLVSTNGVGFFGGTSLYGNSLVMNPEGHLLWEAGTQETVATITLDLDLVARSRIYGTIFMDHYLQHLYEYAFPMPYSNNILDAPLYTALTKAPGNIQEYENQVKEIGLLEIGKSTGDMLDTVRLEENLIEFLNANTK
ncbi:carbon-nitrogen hydrolase family protein [Sinanaerobacter chloroacetimidivorans]|uniref:Carbon-nitrogen hydrolase family protein n=1 Tax=Sinanaerobacter chloroacetimidivorans TaxID=2818044 RepID=A0A8J7W6G8_9FIRM|nr:carbon-nitrogen hydrolase family protein [Sinanaerobacter chloroacetimidivorans]MBR0599973.1 carbon-nitrogen hydrolase family protein [Sinanaerobacter chloroacetimidivorans]